MNAKKITQKELAKACGLSLSTIRRCENSAMVSPSTTDKLAKGLSLLLGRKISRDQLIKK